MSKFRLNFIASDTQPYLSKKKCTIRDTIK